MRRHIRRGAALLGAATLLAAGLLYGRSEAAEPPAAAAAAVATAAVRRGDVAAQVNQNGTLSYAAQADGSDYPIVNQAAGVYTKLPAAGQVVKCGRVLYWVGDEPVLLICGGRPFYRDLWRGRDGWDVKILNQNLRDLGYATRDQIADGEDEFTAETADALAELQEARGADDTGVLRVGGAVVLPGPVRITSVTAQLGGRAVPGGPAATAAGTRREVAVALNAAQQAQVKVGDRAQVTLPDNRVTPGRVSRIGSVATAGKDGSGATVPVYLTLDRPADAGTLDAAPVQVRITTAGVKNALIVPVTALVGQGGGGFAVERVDAAGRRETVPVRLGLFDDAAGTVQVSGALAAGDRVVVPSS